MRVHQIFRLLAIAATLLCGGQLVAKEQAAPSASKAAAVAPNAARSSSHGLNQVGSCLSVAPIWRAGWLTQRA